LNIFLDDSNFGIVFFSLFINMYTNDDIEIFLKKIIDRQQNQVSQNGKNF